MQSRFDFKWKQERKQTPPSRKRELEHTFLQGRQESSWLSISVREAKFFLCRSLPGGLLKDRRAGWYVACLQLHMPGANKPAHSSFREKERGSRHHLHYFRTCQEKLSTPGHPFPGYLTFQRTNTNLSVVPASLQLFAWKYTPLILSVCASYPCSLETTDRSLFSIHSVCIC